MPEILVVPYPKEIEILEHQTLLGTGKSYSENVVQGIQHVYSCYELKLWAMEENQEWTNIKFLEYTSAKFILIRELLFDQIKSNGRFDIPNPFKNPCSKCNGTGELWKFVRKSQDVNCMKCIEGKLPDGSKCKTCRGNGELKTFGIIAQLRGTTTCTYCKGKGFFKPPNLDNPLVNDETAEALQKLVIVEKQVPKNLGAEIEVADATPEPDPPVIEVTPDQVE